MKKAMFAVAAVLAVLAIIITACPADTNDSKSGDNYKVTFDLNYEGAPAVDPVWVPKGGGALEDNFPSAPARQGWVFDGWYDDLVFFTAYKEVVKNTSLKAMWTKLWTLTFDPNVEGASPVGTITVRDGRTASLPEAPANAAEGIIFAGWFDSANLTEEYRSDTVITADVNLIAKWFFGYRVAFAGTLSVMDDALVEAGAALGGKLPATLELPEKFSFGGWFDENGGPVTAGTPITDNITLTAKWDKDPDVQRIGSVNNAMALYKFTVPEGDAFGNYSKITFNALINHENTNTSAPQLRLYGNFADPAIFASARGGAVRFASLNTGNGAYNGPYILHNWKTHSAPRNVWRTAELPFTGQRNTAYVADNFPAADATGDFYFCFSLSTQGVGSPAPVPYPPLLISYVTEVKLSSDDGTKTILSTGNGFDVPAFLGWGSDADQFSCE
ncbi:MAG: InlB B-repeat-containing protein [Treponema sp.]|nr:InlB B-repeat-containing protein [Treponema sp.]